MATMVWRSCLLSLALEYVCGFSCPETHFRDVGSARQPWTLCWPALQYGGCEDRRQGVPARVPGTVLASMLESNFSNLDPYLAMNLQQLPDIHQVGASYYTVRYRTRLPSASCGHLFRSLHLRAASYATRVWVDGAERGSVTGMFRRLKMAVPTEAFDLEIETSPPPHFGVNVSGQGGDHQLAKDGPLAQFALGWDWIQATPDRNTGLWDKVELVSSSTPRIEDLYVRTALQPGEGQDDAVLAVEAREAPCGLKWRVRHHSDLSLDAEGLLAAPGCPGSSATLRSARFWWPWQLGEPHMYEVEILSDVGNRTVLRQLFGIRHSEVYYEPRTKGPAFRMNGRRIFLAGVNWITTDQMLRFSTDAERYESEVRLMRMAGANVIRVWGGGIAERPEFYQACDRLGMLVYQEFWMTGDNNGEQAGSFSWPLDHQVFLDNVEDTVLLLRGHPSLFWWGGGNELWPSEGSPPIDISRAERRFVEVLDGSRPYIQTSSLLQQMQSYDPKNVTAALSVDDGPYGSQVPGEFFERNPYLRYQFYPNRTGLQPFPLSINPELGGPNFPTFAGLRRFIRTQEVPGRLGHPVPAEFAWHNFEAFVVNVSTTSGPGSLVDPIYDLWPGSAGSAMDQKTYADRASVVQYVQYRSLFEGYLRHQWSWYAGLLLWKGQSPWPSLRGFLYDWHLEKNSAHEGMGAALRHLDHVLVSLQPCVTGAAQLYRVNREVKEVSETEVVVTFFSLPRGEMLTTKLFHASSLEPEGVALLGQLTWPRREGALLLRMHHNGNVLEHLLSDPCNGDALLPGMDYRNLAPTPTRLEVVQGGTEANITNAGAWTALLVHPRLWSGTSEILPVWWSVDYFNLLPGESKRLVWSSPPGHVTLSGFNVPEPDELL
ncbi:EBM, partial [Symbiodinium sp. CCMP2456]